MNREESLKKLAEQIQETPSQVNPDLWANISSQIGSGAAGAASGTAAVKSGWSLTTWIATSVVGIGAVVAGVVLVTGNNEETTSSVNPVNEQTAIVDEVKQQPSVKETNTEDATLPIVKEQEKVATIETSNETVGANPIHSELKSAVSGTSGNVSGGETSKGADDLAETEVNNRADAPTNATNQATKKDDFINSLQDTPERPSTTSNRVEDKATKPVNDIADVDESEQDKSTEIVGGIDHVPNVFTPNNDRNNDEFFITSHGLSDYSLVIMDQRSGQVVWKTTDPAAKWNGIMFNGQPAPDGMYVYMIAAKDANDNPISASQTLRIAR